MPILRTTRTVAPLAAMVLVAGCAVVGPPPGGRTSHYHQGPPAGEDVVWDVARAFNRVVAGVEYGVKQGTQQFESYDQPAEMAVDSPPDPAAELRPAGWAPEIDRPSTESASPVQTVGVCAPIAEGPPAIYAPPARFFPVPVRPVFSPQIAGPWSH